MAKMEMKMPDELADRLSRLGGQTDRIAEACLKEGAEVALAAVRGGLSAAIGSGLEYEGRSTGELLSSLGAAPVLVDRDGNSNTHIGFNEPRRRQRAAKGRRSYGRATNAMIANVLEYGKHGQPPKPFLKAAMASSRRGCAEAMQKAFDREAGNL